jgi:hypothetical protein
MNREAGEALFKAMLAVRNTAVTVALAKGEEDRLAAFDADGVALEEFLRLLSEAETDL